MKEFIITSNDSNRRLDGFVLKVAPTLSKSLMYKYIRIKRIKINNKRSDISTRLNTGDKVQMYINDEYFVTQNAPLAFLSAPVIVDIIYEDANIFLVNKPAGLVVHDDETKSPDTLINRMLHYLYDKKEYLPEQENSFVPSLCNRIDRNTSGIVIGAKNAEALREMNRIIKEREITKKYLCVAKGIFEKKQGTETIYIRRNEKTKTVEVSKKFGDGFKTAITKYKVLAEQDNKSLVEVTLVTGRTHQIRAHFAHLGHPLWGDGKYGHTSEDKTAPHGQVLTAYKLTFNISGTESSLSYLNGKTFTVKDIWFLKEFSNYK